MLTTSLILLSFLATNESSARSVPDVNDVVSAMLRKEADRRSAFEGYTGTRTYVLENAAYHKRAEMTVRIVCQRDGTKQFEILSASGWGGARKHVFSRLLETEAVASKPGNSEESRVTPQNYSFRMLGVEEIDGRVGLCDRGYAESAENIPDARYDLGGCCGLRDCPDARFTREEPFVLHQEGQLHAHVSKARLNVAPCLGHLPHRCADIRPCKGHDPVPRIPDGHSQCHASGIRGVG